MTFEALFICTDASHRTSGLEVEHAINPLISIFLVYAIHIEFDVERYKIFAHAEHSLHVPDLLYIPGPYVKALKRNVLREHASHVFTILCIQP